MGPRAGLDVSENRKISLFIPATAHQSKGRDSSVGIATRYRLDGPGIESPIPVAVRSKAWVCGRPLAGIVGSNPTGVMDVCVVFVVRTIAWNVK